MPKVSVIIPNYNHARYLDRRIRSVLDQTYRDFEVIFLDDASTDESREVFRKYEDDPRIRSVFNRRNSGIPFKQWNAGVRMAAGEYVWIAESDDYCELDFLETMVGILDADPDVGIACCRSCMVDENDNVLRVWFPWHKSIRGKFLHDFVNSGRVEVARSMIYENIIPNASAAVFRKSIYERAGYADETMRVAGDMMLWISMLEMSDFAYVARTLNCFRTHSGSVRHRTHGDGRIYLEEYAVLSRILKNHSVAYIDSLRVRNRLLKDLAVFLLSRHGRKQREIKAAIYTAARAVEPWLGIRLPLFLFRRMVEHAIYLVGRLLVR